MSCRSRNNSVTLLPMRRAQFVRVALCVLASLVAALCMGGYGAQTALYEFVGGGLLVPSLSGTRPNIMVLIAWFAPQAAFCFLFSDVLAGGLGSDAATVLPRVGSRRVWLASKLVHLALLSAAFSLLGQLANGAVQLVWGCGANMPELIGVVARCAALGFPLMLCLALAVNCLALKLEPVVAFAVVEGVYVAGLVGLAYLPREAAMAVAEKVPHLLVVVNKSDLPRQLDIGALADRFDNVLSVSAVTGAGLDTLTDAIAAQFPSGETAGGALLTNARQADAANRALSAVAEARGALRIGMTPDVVLTDCEAALAALGELNGKQVRDDLVDTIFSRFCVGK